MIVYDSHLFLSEKMDIGWVIMGFKECRGRYLPPKSNGINAYEVFDYIVINFTLC